MIHIIDVRWHFETFFGWMVLFSNTTFRNHQSVASCDCRKRFSRFCLSWKVSCVQFTLWASKFVRLIGIPSRGLQIRNGFCYHKVRMRWLNFRLHKTIYNQDLITSDNQELCTFWSSDNGGWRHFHVSGFLSTSFCKFQEHLAVQKIIQLMDLPIDDLRRGGLPFGFTTKLNPKAFGWIQVGSQVCI